MYDPVMMAYLIRSGEGIEFISRQQISFCCEKANMSKPYNNAVNRLFYSPTLSDASSIYVMLHRINLQ